MASASKDLRFQFLDCSSDLLRQIFISCQRVIWRVCEVPDRHSLERYTSLTELHRHAIVHRYKPIEAIQAQAIKVSRQTPAPTPDRPQNYPKPPGGGGGRNPTKTPPLTPPTPPPHA